MSLFDAVCGQPLCKNVGHFLRWEGNREGEFGIVSGHGGDVLGHSELEK